MGRGPTNTFSSLTLPERQVSADLDSAAFLPFIGIPLVMGLCPISRLAAAENRVSSVAKFAAKSFIPVRFGLRAMQAFVISSLNNRAGGYYLKRDWIRWCQGVLDHNIAALHGVPPAVGAEFLCSSLESFGLGGADLFLSCSLHFLHGYLQAFNSRNLQTH